MEFKKKFSRKYSCSRRWLKLLFSWKGSLYKLCYKEILFFVLAFGTFSMIYRLVLEDDSQKDVFRQWVRYCETYITRLPISWILGFYVATMATRWWQQCMTLPAPDRLMMAIVMYIPGDDNESRLLRKTLCQNCNLMIVLLLRSISDSVRSKWETLEDLVKAGFMTKREKQLYESAEAEYPEMDLYWLPGVWFSHNMREAQKQGKMSFSDGARLIMAEFLTVRSKCDTLWSYNWVSIPIIYTQVVTLATYSFLIASIFGRQFIGKGEDEISVDIFFPTWAVLENLFYLGLLKVANHMLNPSSGNDDESFDLIYLIKQQANAVHIGTHGYWDKRPLMDLSILERPKFEDRKKESLKQRVSRVLSTMGVISPRRFSILPIQEDVIAEDSLTTSFTGNCNSMFINDDDGTRLESTFNQSVDSNKINNFSIEIKYK